MQIKVFAIPFSDSMNSFDDRAMQSFLAKRTVVSKTDHFFEYQGRPYLGIIVNYEQDKNSRQVKNDIESLGIHDPQKQKEITQPTRAENITPTKAAKRQPDSAPKPEKQAYSPTELDQKQRGVYESMRKWRFDRAKSQTIPAYMVCSNRELEQIVKSRPSSPEELKKIGGMGQGKIQNHGTAIVQALIEIQMKNNGIGKGATY